VGGGVVDVEGASQASQVSVTLLPYICFHIC
jgi:hypothetical protein